MSPAVPVKVTVVVFLGTTLTPFVGAVRSFPRQLYVLCWNGGLMPPMSWELDVSVIVPKTICPLTPAAGWHVAAVPQY